MIGTTFVIVITASVIDDATLKTDEAVRTLRQPLRALLPLSPELEPAGPPRDPELWPERAIRSIRMTRRER